METIITYADVLALWLVSIYEWFATFNFGMTPDNFQAITEQYLALGGAESCTPDLDRVHQGRWIVTTTLNTLGQLLGVGHLFDPCPYIPPS